MEQFDGRPAVVARFDQAHRRGAITPPAGETLAEACRHALVSSVPFVAFLASSGADVHEGVASLHSWGLAARELARCSGSVPTIIVVDGPAISGPALLLGLADIVIMTDRAYAFVTGPRMIREYTGVEVTEAGLGGPGVSSRQNGVASLVVPDAEAAADLVGLLLSLLPPNVDSLPPVHDTDDPVDRELDDIHTLMPATPTGSYDVREVISRIVDDGELLELRNSWAPNIVTALAGLGGRTVGVVANQPSQIAGTLDIPASQKGARFVAFCDAFNIPLLTLIDTPGFYPGRDLEWRGMIRHGAQMAFAYARATVPRLAVTLRKSYGGAYIVMDSKRMGNDLMLAWPSAEIAVMGAKGAVEILHRRADHEERARQERAYEERLLNPYIAAERGSVDIVIEPSQTRRELIAGLAVLEGKQEQLRPRRHDNTPL